MNNILCIIDLFWIFIREYTIYILFKDYDNFIYNITNKLSKINVLYIKVFQAFALNNNIVDKKWSDKFMKFADNAPWNKDEISWETIKELENKYNLDFGDYQPINSGMISIVFKVMEKNTKEPFIIKMQRKNISKKLDNAIDQLLFLVYFFSFIPILKSLNIDNIIKQNIDLLNLQLNFKNEVDNMNKMKSNCKNLSYIKIPNVYDDVTNEYPNIIMMEYIDGKKIVDIDPNDSIHYAKLCIKFGLITLLIHGLSHADLHCGNILFIKNPNNIYQIGVLDFGIVYNIDKNIRDNLLKIFVNLFQEDTKTITNRFLYSGLIEPIENIENIPKNHQDNIINIISNVLIQKKNDKDNKTKCNIFKSVTELKEYIDNHKLNVYGIRPSDSFIQLQLGLIMNDGLVSSFDKYNNYISILDSVITEMFHLDILFEDE